QYTDKLLKTAYKICRWHHERYDGNGYPDGLKGEEIPISAQIVAIADVYDALTSERCYKKAIPHEKAMEMILGGQCGAFNPYLLDCLVAISEDLKREMTVASAPLKDERSIRQMTQKMLHDDEMTIPVQVLKKLEYERTKSAFYASLLPGTVFKYTAEPPMLTLIHPERLSKALPSSIMNPFENPFFLEKPLSKLFLDLKETSEKITTDEFHIDRTLQWRGEKRSFRCDCLTMRGDVAPNQFFGVVGRIQELSNAFLESPLEEKEALPQYSMTAKQANTLQQQLACAFDIVRIVDAEKTKQICIDCSGKKTFSDYYCYDVWDKSERCKNCISSQVKRGRGKVSKFEFVNDAVYYVTALHIEVDGEPCSLEMVTHIKDDVLLNSRGSGCLTDIIQKHNQKLFMDPVTGVFNRRYYEERIAVSYDVKAVAMLDLDDFKQINDAFGHQAGDTALQQVARIISGSLAEGDEVARYGGDEFIIVTKDEDGQRFMKTLQQVSKELSEMSVEEDTRIRLTASIGVKLGGKNVPEMVQAADRLMYEAKNKKNFICVE
ncbi:MAG: diguanylate cyclase, partial [Anaerotignum sp.]